MRFGQEKKNRKHCHHGLPSQRGKSTCLAVTIPNGIHDSSCSLSTIFLLRLESPGAADPEQCLEKAQPLVKGSSAGSRSDVSETVTDRLRSRRTVLEAVEAEQVRAVPSLVAGQLDVACDAIMMLTH